jgi:hypothetical protein
MWAFRGRYLREQGKVKGKEKGVTNEEPLSRIELSKTVHSGEPNVQAPRSIIAMGE